MLRWRPGIFRVLVVYGSRSWFVMFLAYRLRASLSNTNTLFIQVIDKSIGFPLLTAFGGYG
jgi:hypothetical protein